MNKAELVKHIAKIVDLSEKKSKEVLDGVIEAISNSLKKGEEVVLIGFGSFKVSNRKARMGLNPRTGEKMKIRAKKVPVFKAGKALKEKVDK